MGQFFDYLEQLVFEVETGRMRASQARDRLIRDWGGTVIRGYVPQRDPKGPEKHQIRALIDAGLPPRTARAKVRGK